MSTTYLHLSLFSRLALLSWRRVRQAERQRAAEGVGSSMVSAADAVSALAAAGSAALRCYFTLSTSSYLLQFFLPLFLHIHMHV